MLDEIKRTQESLRKGGVILFPTDTTWAIGCDATNEDAVKRLSLIIGKNGPFVSILPHSDWLSTYVVKVPDIAWDLVDFAEKSLTVIYDKGKNLAAGVMGTDGTVALRVTKDSFCKDLMMRLQRPLVATRISDEIRRFPQITENIKELVDYIVALRQDEKVSEPLSTIMRLGEGGQIKFIRKS